MEKTKRKFKMSEAEIVAKVDAFNALATRDDSDYTAFGLEAGALTAITSALSSIAIDLTSYNTDSLYVAQLKNLTAIQKGNREKLITWIRNNLAFIKAYLEYRYGGGSYASLDNYGIWVKFLGCEGYNNMSDADLYNCVAIMKVKLLAGSHPGPGHENLSADLKNYVETANLITSDHLNFYQGMLDIKAAKYNRSAGEMTRTAKLNQAYHYLVQLSNIGKAVFRDNPAKYNEYRLYPPKPEITYNLPAVTNLAYNNTTKLLSWTASAGASFYRIEYSLNAGGTWTLLGTTADTSITLDKDSNQLMARVYAYSGSDRSQWRYLAIGSTLASPNQVSGVEVLRSETDAYHTRLIVTWDPVPGAIQYQVYASTYPDTVQGEADYVNHRTEQGYLEDHDAQGDDYSYLTSETFCLIETYSSYSGYNAKVSVRAFNGTNLGEWSVTHNEPSA